MIGNYALITAGKVTNVIVCDADFATAYVADSNEYDSYICVDGLAPAPGMGWAYDGTHFTAPPEPVNAEPSPQDVARENAGVLLAKTHRTAAETAQLITTLANLAGVTPEVP